MHAGYKILFALCLVGCSAPSLPTSYDVDISDHFTVEEINNIEFAFNSWSLENGPSFNFHLVVTDDLPAEESVPWDTMVVRKTTYEQIKSAIGPGHVAYTISMGYLASYEDNNLHHTNAVGPSIYLLSTADLPNPDDWISVAAHEAGHGLGLMHTGPGTLMYFTSQYKDGIIGPTCADMQYYWHIRNEQHYCNF